MGVETLTDAAATRPCVYCGRPVPQRGSAGRPFRYCRDNDGDCQRSARNGRVRERNSPGLAGQVARSWELVERLELLAGTLADALHAELSPAGVERQTAMVRVEAATHVAGAHTERDEARREAESARAELARGTDSLAVANRRAEEHTQHLARLSTELDSLRDAAGAAEHARDEARSAATAEAALRLDAQNRRNEALAAVDAHRSALAAAERVRNAALADRDTAVVAATTAATARDEALAGRAEAVAERDDARAHLARTREELATATETLRVTGERLTTVEATAAADRDVHLKAVWERDAARADLVAALAATEAARTENAAVSARSAVLAGELAAAQAELAGARVHARQLAEQVTNVTAALARLGHIPAQAETRD